ncbi:MAG TPA: PLDc N-terminal domain-containing protein [Thermoanaerobaculia bacterium]
MIIVAGLVLAVATTIFWIWMLVAAATHERANADKIVWVLIILFTHVLGALVYFVVRYTPRERLV